MIADRGSSEPCICSTDARNPVISNEHSIRQGGRCDRIRGVPPGKRTGGTHFSDKDRAYRASCRNQVKAGYINDANGNWIKYSESGIFGNMHRDQRMGYKL